MGCFNNFDTKLSFVITFKIIYMFYHYVVYGMPVGTLIFIVFYNRYISINSALNPVIIILFIFNKEVPCIFHKCFVMFACLIITKRRIIKK